MKQATQTTLICLIMPSVATFLCLAAFPYVTVAFADEASPSSSTVPKVPARLARHIAEITDAVLAHHIDPPAAPANDS